MTFPSQFFVVSLLVVCLHAFPALEKRQQGNAYIAPVYPTDVRGPCPALNTLSNHGFLDRNGVSLSVPLLVRAMTEVYSTDGQGLADLILPTIKGLFETRNGTLVLPNFTALTNSHLICEHDASLVRNDNDVGGEVKPGQVGPLANVSLLNQLISFSTDGIYLTTEQLAKASALRLDQSMNYNPKYMMTQGNFGGLFIERALLCMVTGRRSDNWRIRVDWLRVFLGEERLPYELGWVSQNTTLPELLALSQVFGRLIPTFLPPPPNSSTTTSSTTSSSSTTTTSSTTSSNTTTTTTTSEGASKTVQNATLPVPAIIGIVVGVVVLVVIVVVAVLIKKGQGSKEGSLL